MGPTPRGAGGRSVMYRRGSVEGRGAPSWLHNQFGKVLQVDSGDSGPSPTLTGSLLPGGRGEGRSNGEFKSVGRMREAGALFQTSRITIPKSDERIAAQARP